jgi:hypothetical protein
MPNSTGDDEAKGGNKMVDATSKEPLRVIAYRNNPPFFYLPVTELAKVQRLLDSQSIHYEVDENEISLDGEPLQALIELDWDADPVAIQAILDGAT